MELFRRLSRKNIRTDFLELFNKVTTFDTKKFGHIFNQRTSPNVKRLSMGCTLYKQNIGVKTEDVTIRSVKCKRDA